jgi:hypothetical protein
VWYDEFYLEQILTNHIRKHSYGVLVFSVIVIVVKKTMNLMEHDV